MFSFLMGLINPISAIAKGLTEAKVKSLDAETEQQRIAAEVVVDQLEARQAVLIAEQGSFVTRWIRPMFALPFIIYNFKVVVYDSVFGLGVTAELSNSYWQLQMIVFGAYFLTRGLEKRKKN